MNRKFVTTLLVVMLSIAFSMTVQAADYKTPDQLVKEAKAAIKEVSPADLKKMLDSKENVIVLDIRDRDEYEKQRIPGSIHMSRGLVDLHVEEIIPDKNAKIVLL
ncbi:MAG: rhodanese-like domain-containing protein [Nitrospirota bacterium]